MNENPDLDADQISIDDLPRFAATRELIIRYGDNWATWAFFGTGALFLVILGVSFADATGASAADSIPPMLFYGGCTFAAGMFIGTLRSDLIDDAKEREAMKRVD